MAAALEFQEVVKRFGRFTALGGLTLTIPDRAIAAFVGANGAGKTTSFSLIGGYFKPDSGHIRVLGQALKDFRYKGGLVGLLPQDVEFFELRTIERQLFLFARLAGYSRSAAFDEVERVITLVQLRDRSRQTAENLSHGMKVRLGIAQALIGHPELILLDEPTAGLDPRMVQVFRSIIDSLRGKLTIVISSHDLSQLELMCDYVCIIDHGKLVRQGPLRELLLSKVSSIYIRLVQSGLDLRELQAKLPELNFHMRDGTHLQVDFDSKAFGIAQVNTRVLGWLIERGIEFLEVESQRSLEQTYLEETKG